MGWAGRSRSIRTPGPPLQTLLDGAGRYPSSPWSRFSWSGCFPAFYPASDSEARDAAKKLLAVCLAGRTPIDWDEVDRLAALPSFGVAEQMADLKAEVERELG